MNITVNTAEFNAALSAYLNATTRDVAEIINQRMANVTHWALEELPPKQDPQAERARIKAYLTKQISQRVRPTAKGRFVKAGRKSAQLQLRYLIIQARRKKKGLKGAYGRNRENEMAAPAEALLRRAIASVGFAKSLLISAVQALNPIVKFKIPFRLTAGIARWSDPAGDSRVQVAKPGLTPQGFIEITVDTKSPVSGFHARLLQDAFDKAIEKETSEMIDQIREKVHETAKKHFKEVH